MSTQIFSAISTNGRWGLAVVGPEGTTFPAQGRLRALGEVAGIATFQFTPDDTAGTWVLPLKSAAHLCGGGTLVHQTGLQSGQSASLLLLGREAVIQCHGYRGRDSWYRAFVEGEEKHIPAPVLLAMGLIKPDPKPEPEPIPEPAPLQGAMAAAFAALRG